MEQRINETKSHLTVCIADERLLAKRLEQEAARASEGVAQLEEQLRLQRALVEELKRGVRELTTALEESKTKRHILLARSHRAEAQLQLSGEESSMPRVERTEQVTLTAGAKERIRAARLLVEKHAESDEPVYGVNTGFGFLSNVRIPKKD